MAGEYTIDFSDPINGSFDINALETNGPGVTNAVPIQSTSNAVANVFSVYTDWTTRFIPGFTFDVVSSGYGNNGTYTVLSSVHLDQQPLVSVPTTAKFRIADLTGDFTKVLIPGRAIRIQQSDATVSNDGIWIVLSSTWLGLTTEVTLRTNNITVPTGYRGGTGDTLDMSETTAVMVANQTAIEVTAAIPITVVNASSILVPDGTIEYTFAAQTSLALPGRGALNYGENIIEDLVHMTEHFAGPLAPAAPIQGQMWYDNGTATPFIFGSDIYQVIAVNTGTGVWTISGNHVVDFAVGNRIAVFNDYGLTSDMGLVGGTVTYEVLSAVLNGGNTDITIDTTPSNPLDETSINVGADGNGNLYNMSDWVGLVTLPVAESTYVRLDGTNTPMTGDLDMGTNFITNLQQIPVNPGDAASKYYVDQIASGITWVPPIIDPDLNDISSVNPTIVGGSLDDTITYIKYGGVQGETWIQGGASIAVSNGDVAIFTITNVIGPVGDWAILESPLLTDGRFIIAGVHGTAGATLLGMGFVDDDLIQYDNLSNPGVITDATNWSTPSGSPPTDGTTTLVTDQDSPHIGISYLYSASSAMWIELSASISAPLNEIVYGTGSAVGSEPDFTWDPTSDTLTVGGVGDLGTITNGDGGTIEFDSGIVRLTGDNGDFIEIGASINITGVAGALGSTVTITSGNATLAGTGGNAILTAGSGGNTGTAGTTTISGGAGGATSGAGGLVTIQGGLPTDGVGGAVTITGRDAAGVGDYTGGAVNITSGNSTGTTDGSSVNVTAGDATGSDGNGGDVVLQGGLGFDEGIGGGVTLIAGDGGSAGLGSIGGSINLTGGNGGAIDGAGGNIILTSGNAVGTSLGGYVSLTGGNGDTTGNGGAVNLTGGAGGLTSGNGGALNLTSGTPNDGGGGAINTTGADGVGTNKSGGAISITAGNSTGTVSGGTATLRSGNGGNTGFGGTSRIYGGDGGAISGSAGSVQLIGGECVIGVGGDVELNAGSGGSTSGNGGAIALLSGSGQTEGNGGNINITTGNGVGTARNGGVVTITGGSATTSGTGGNISATAGSGGDTGIAGAVTITGGTSGGVSGDGGIVTISAGAAGAGVGGAVTVIGGSGSSGGGDAEFKAGAGVGNLGGSAFLRGGASSAGGNSGSANVRGGTPTGGSGNGGDVDIRGGNALGTSKSGGNTSMTAGASTTAVTGGTMTITAGTGGATGNGGATTISGGSGGATSGVGGQAIFQGGASTGAGNAGGTVTIRGGQPADGNGGSATLGGRNAVGTARDGGAASVSGGNATTSGTGGQAALQSGAAATTGIGGLVDIVSGAGGSVSGASGAITIRTGATTDGNIGTISITGGSASGTARNGGKIDITAGAASDSSGTPGAITQITSGGFWVQRAGNFAADDDARSNQYILRTQTTNATVTEMFLDGTGGTRRMTLSNDSTWRFEIFIAARRTDANDESAAYEVKGAIDRNASAATTAIVGGVSYNVTAEDTAAWDITVDADTTNGALRIQVTGEAAKTIRWVAFVRTVEVTG